MSERSEVLERHAVSDAAPAYRVNVSEFAKDGVPPGYKRTEVGVIPEDWFVISVKDVGSVKTGPFGTSLKAAEYSQNDGVPLISVGEIQEGYLRISRNTPRISQEVIRRLPQYVLKKGDIVFGRKGGVERSAPIGDKEEGWFLGSDGIVLRPSNRSCSEYMAAQFRSIRVQSWLLQNAIGTTMASLNQSVLQNAKIPIPPTEEEQRAIATALSDADALTESLGRLIAKKHAIKQAAMQQLLTGQTRLPGFTGEWEMKRLGEIGTFYKGQGIRRDEVSHEGLPCIRYGEIYTTYGDCVVEPESRIPDDVAQLAFPLKTGDLLFAGSGETAEEIGTCVAYLGQQSAYAGGDIVILRPLQGNAAYLGRLLNHPTIARQKIRLGQGDAVVHISARNLAQIELQLPSVEEQTAIANVLSDIDADIEVLECRRAKAREIKQGMMQQLLTGRVRLIEPARPARV